MKNLLKGSILRILIFQYFHYLFSLFFIYLSRLHKANHLRFVHISDLLFIFYRLLLLLTVPMLHLFRLIWRRWRRRLTWFRPWLWTWVLSMLPSLVPATSTTTSMTFFISETTLISSHRKRHRRLRWWGIKNLCSWMLIIELILRMHIRRWR